MTLRVWRGLEARRIQLRSSPALPARSPRPPTPRGIVRRGVEAAGHLFDAGDAIRAQELFLEAAAATPRGPARADILWRLADASWLEVDLVRGYLQEGLDDASGDLRVESGIRMDLAWTWVYGGDVARGDDRGPKVPGDRPASRRPIRDLGCARGARDLRVPRRS